MKFERLGPYIIEKQIGQGGMGAVYEATHSETGEKVAVKALAPQLAMTEGFRERFEAEIESLKKLDHRGIVTLFGYGEENGILFYSMELVEGSSLEEELAAGRRFNWREVTEIAIQVCHALRHAHAHGVVHRDIKPANILLTPDQEIRIADFGIARLFGGTQLTNVGGVLGTADYMSPEQADGRALSESCDQYSLGGVMYALLAGRPPFRAKNLPEMLQLQRYAEPDPVRRYAPDTPLQLEKIISQLLSKEPEDRFPNVHVLARLLEAMRKALTRTMSDEFSIEDDWDNNDSMEGITELAREADIAEGPALAKNGLDTTRICDPIASEDAMVDEQTPKSSEEELGATLHQPEAQNQKSRASALTGGVTQHIATQDELLLDDSVDLELLETEDPKRPPNKTHFTTVEEEARWERKQRDSSTLLFATKLAALGAVIAGIVWIGIWTTRAASSEELFAKIDKAGQKQRVEELFKVESDIEEFLQRFPDDPRTQQVQDYREEIRSARLERKLNKIELRKATNQKLLPIEHMYLQANQVASHSPQEGVARLQAILDMYPEATENNHQTDSNKTGREIRDNKHFQACLQVIRKRIKEYKQQELQQQKIILVELEKRMQIAKNIAKQKPEQARAIYKGIISWCGGHPWAEYLVSKAELGMQSLAQENE